MFEFKLHFIKFCTENNLQLQLSFDMPQGYETANGTFDVETKTVYINAEYLREAPDYEQAFFLYHELRHAVQFLFPEKFSDTIIRSLPYTIMFDGTCFKLEDGKYLKCQLEGGEDVFTDVYLSQPYEVDANKFAYERVKMIFGESEKLRNLYDFCMPKKPVPDGAFETYYHLIDEKVK